MEWVNIGDQNLEMNGLLVKNMELDSDGDFMTEVIEIIPESDIGGSENIFRIIQGSMYLSAECIESAMRVTGLIYKDRHIYDGRYDSHDSLIYPADSQDGLIKLCHANYAYHGIENDAISYVRIGLPTRSDQEPKFDMQDDSLTVYPQGTSLWAVLRQECIGFQDCPEENPQKAVPYDLSDGPFANMPEIVQTRADLANMGGFAQLAHDENGNPKVWMNTYTADCCEAGSEDMKETATGEDTEIECQDCGVFMAPVSSVWIGPKEPELQELWQKLEDSAEAIDSKPEESGKNPYDW